MAVKQASLDAYHIIIQPKLAECQRVVYDVICQWNPIAQKNDWTNKEIARYLGKEINEITPRTGELANMKPTPLIIEGEKRHCAAKPTRIMVGTWRVNNGTLF